MQRQLQLGRSEAAGFERRSHCTPIREHLSPSMLVDSVRRILHDATVHRLSDRYSNRFSCVVIDEARRAFEEDIAGVLEDIELAKRLQRVVAASFHLGGKLIAPTPRQPHSSLRRPE